LADVAGLQKKLGVSFHSLALLEEALVHTSYTNENPGLAPVSNERLEFLGDAVLELIIAAELFAECRYSTEGELTILRAALVRRETLADVARRIGLGEYIYLGKGEETGDGRNKNANLAGAMEAVIGAIFLDRGWSATRKAILKLFEPELEETISKGVPVDYKSRLQEIIQANNQVTPTYHVVDETGPDHDKVFTVEVRTANKVLGKGKGKSKKLAETEAARFALQQLPSTFTRE
jgi:ribonuclease-3